MRVIREQLKSLRHDEMVSRGGCGMFMEEGGPQSWDVLEDHILCAGPDY